jgi:hypothetical protein
MVTRPVASLATAASPTEIDVVNLSRALADAVVAGDLERAETLARDIRKDGIGERALRVVK